MTIFELMDLIQTKKQCIALWQRIRWKDGLLCHSCGVYDSAHKQGTTKYGFQKYKCICGHIFSDTSNTILHRKRVDLKQWFYGLYEISQTKGITSVELSKRLGVPQKKAWNQLNILREHCQEIMKIYHKKRMRGVTEVDEAHLGKNDNSTMVQGLVQRNQHAVIVPIKDRTEPTLKGNIDKYIKKKSYVMTDTAAAYGGLDCSDYSHFTLNHSKDEFSKGDGIHSNTIEGLWGNLKKVLYGIHHGVKKKNLMNYVSEFLIKYNLKQAKSTFPAFLHLFIIPPLTC